MGAEFSDLLCADIDIGVLLVDIVGDGEGAVKFRLPPGPVGGLNPAGPLGGDRGRIGGDRSRGVDRAESRSRYASCWDGGDRSRVIGGERALVACCTVANRLG